MSEIFYIPGLGGDSVVDSQRKYVGRLNKFLRKKIFFFDPAWQTNEPATEKLGRLHHDYIQEGRPQKIFAVSAGASLAIILAGSDTSTAHITTIAGKLKGSASIGTDYRQRAPAFLEMVHRSEDILVTDPSVSFRLTTYSPIFYDGIVPLSDMEQEGARNRTILMPRHAPAIIASLAVILPLA